VILLAPKGIGLATENCLHDILNRGNIKTSINNMTYKQGN